MFFHRAAGRNLNGRANRIYNPLEHHSTRGKKNVTFFYWELQQLSDT